MERIWLVIFLISCAIWEIKSIRCKDGYEVEMGELGTSSRKNCNDVCGRTESTVALGPIITKITHWGCYTLSDCFTLTCSSIRERLESGELSLPILDLIDIEDVDISDCVTGCCDNKRGCNSNSLDSMNLLTTTTSTAPATTRSTTTTRRTTTTTTLPTTTLSSTNPSTIRSTTTTTALPTTTNSTASSTTATVAAATNTPTTPATYTKTFRFTKRPTNNTTITTTSSTATTTAPAIIATSVISTANATTYTTAPPATSATAETAPSPVASSARTTSADTISPMMNKTAREKRLFTTARMKMSTTSGGRSAFMFNHVVLGITLGGFFTSGI